MEGEGRIGLPAECGVVCLRSQHLGSRSRWLSCESKASLIYIAPASQLGLHCETVSKESELIL